MSLDYEKIKSSEESKGNEWTSYSDLFMVLAFVFLMLYVTSSIKTGTSQLQKNEEIIRLTKEIEALKEEQRVQETLKDDYLVNDASERERQEYQKLMSHLNLLETEAKEAKEEFERQAAEQRQKEQALNHYQRMIKNVITANILSKDRLNQRDDKIDQKNRTIAEKQDIIKQKLEEIQKNENIIEQQNQKVSQLEGAITSKVQEIQKNKQRMKSIKDQMDQKIAELNKSYKNKRIAYQQAMDEIRALQIESEKKINDLKTQNTVAEKRLNRINNQLNSAQSKISQAQQVIKMKDQEKQRLAEAFKMEKSELKQQFSKEKSKLISQYQKEKEQIMDSFENEKKQLAASLSQQTESLKKKYAKQQVLLKKKLKQANDEYKQQQQQLAKKLENTSKQYNQKISGLQKDLKKAEARENARKQLAKKIKTKFAKAGIKMDVDENTGEVVLSFGDEYFETGRHSLKPKMKEILKDFIPLYAQSLFEDKDISRRIEDVQIVGFASPTFKGQVVNPNSLSKKDRKAVSYNLDLSYNRAKSIFNYMFYDKDLDYDHQKKLLSMVKVSGAGYFGGSNRNPSSEEQVTCKEKDCKDLQKVIIKFNLNNR